MPEEKATPLKPPMFSGSFRLSVLRGPMGTMVNHLFSFPGSIHSRELGDPAWNQDRGPSSAVALISACVFTHRILHLYTWGTRLGLLSEVVVAHFVSRRKHTVSG